MIQVKGSLRVTVILVSALLMCEAARSSLKPAALRIGK